MEDDGKPRLRDPLVALALLTRLPVPSHAPRGAAAAWAWPLAGALVGAIAGLIGTLALAVGAAAGLAAGLALTASVMLTGAMHEDGLADSADGLWGGWTPDHRLEIMRDSRIGTYGVVALVASLGIRWLALTHLFALGQGWAAMIGVAALTRLPMVCLARALPFARPEGLSASVGRPGGRTVALGALATLLLVLPALGPASLPAALAATLAALLAARIATARIGGQTGDILGATQQVCEVAVLATLTL